MSDWNPKGLWDELVRTLLGQGDERDEPDRSADPTLLFHLMLTVPVVLGLLLMARRA